MAFQSMMARSPVLWDMLPGQQRGDQTMSIGGDSSGTASRAMGKRPGKRPGRKPSKVDERAKLEKSRQSARECRARKKLRYQYLEELVSHREKAVFALRDELETYKQWCCHLDKEGAVPDSLLKMIVNEDLSKRRRQIDQSKKSILRQEELERDSLSSSSSASSPASEEERPRVGLHNFPRIIISTNPTASSSQSQPATLQTRNQPQPATLQTRNQPQPTTLQTGNQPQPTTLQTGNQPQPATLQTRNQPQPATLQTRNQPQPATLQSRNQPQPTTLQSRGQPQPATLQSRNQPQPATLQTCNQPQPATLQTCNQPQPATLQTCNQPQPATLQSRNQPQPATLQSRNQPQPATLQTCNQPQPATLQTRNQPQPATLQTRNQPQPATLQSCNQPQPTTLQSRNQPQPATLQSRNQPQPTSLQSLLHQPQLNRMAYIQTLGILQQQRLQLQNQNQLPTTSTTPLLRQMAFDQSAIQDDPKHQSHQLSPKAGSTGHHQDPAVRPSSNLTSLSQLDHQQKQQKLHQQLEQKRTESSMLNQHPHTLHHQLVQRPQMHFRSSTRSEPPLKYEPSFDLFKEASPELVSRVSELRNETKRVRSFSNPASMTSLPQPDVPGAHGLTSASTWELRSPMATPSSSSSMELASRNAPSAPGFQQLSQRVGLFTGSIIQSGFSQPLTLNLPTSLTIEESSSSDENINEQNLFQSTLMSQKRTISDPALSRSPKRSKHLETSSLSAVSYYDPQAKLRNLTTVHCYSTTRTLNTPSPSSFGLALSSLPSSTSLSRYKGKASSSTPSSSAATSPAPFSSLSSLMDLSVSSPEVSSSGLDTSLDLPYRSILGQTSQRSALSHCSETGLTASIDQPIPELYSFLADLEEGGMSTLTSRHGASSNRSTPSALTPKPADQPLTPDPSFLNVPKIIDEFMDSDDQDL